MKIFIRLTLFFMTLSLSTPLFAAEKSFVCIPDLNTNTRSLSFALKPSTGSCPKDEKLFELQRAEGGVVLFLPYENPSPNTTAPNAIPGNPSQGKPFSYY